MSILRVSTDGSLIFEFCLERETWKMTILKVSTAGSPIFELRPEGERRKSIFSVEITIFGCRMVLSMAE